MSPNVGNFVHDLVEMAKAMETLPQVEHERDELKAKLDEAQGHSQALELRIIDYKEQVERLMAKVRATEAERDDAELRFLDLEEKSSKVVGFLGQLQGMAVQAEVILNPPKPQPEPEPVQLPVPEAVQSIEPQPQGQSESPSSQTGSSQQEHGDGSSASQGSSDANPSSASETTPQTLETASGASAGGDGNVSGEPKPSGPYVGKIYRFHPIYVSPHNWIAGGGTEETYYS